ncbi:2-oxo-4-hydroxy-4-carboxy-5-ureidoimidazoline decarboxylase [Erpetoichthys calabaricus]|uniref:2-oxo-4-hydroxy-4-carboxy-5-ureidoimidazoline decarboxylase n=1 Tax=Erpetoichthys calabaricus TaxID=27687 RepID=A0A8C4S5Q4_ERPCA|nr:2-oxo-4-hydroxy-4-carboxy-5-ureidoimidazoline decarboxylase [Erpetoichthys calabaricus]
MNITKVNSFSYEEFIEVFGNVIEKCPIICAAVWSQQPFSNPFDLEVAIQEFIDNLPTSGKEGILRCHPDLAGGEALRCQLTTESQKEQSGAGLTLLDGTEKFRIDQLNTQYKEKFGFPFVICARMSDKNKIFQQLNERLLNDPMAELRTGIEEVKKICHLRLHDIFSGSPVTKP